VEWDPQQKPLDASAVDKSLPNSVDERIKQKWLSKQDSD
jgi:hypothetical protein